MVRIRVRYLCLARCKIEEYRSEGIRPMYTLHGLVSSMCYVTRVGGAHD